MDETTDLRMCGNAGEPVSFAIQSLFSLSFFSNQFLSGVILLISSLLFVCRYQTSLRLDTLVLLGRFLAGFTYGLTYLTVVIHAAENAVNQIRGVILRGTGYVLSFALFVAGFTTNGTVGNDIYSEIYMGCINLFYSVLALILIPILTIESAPFLYQHNRGQFPDACEKLVISTMVRLRSERQETAKIRYDFDEMKRQVNEDECANRNIFNGENIRALFVISGVRVLSICAKNLPLTVLIMGYSNSLVNPEVYSLYTLLLLLTCRFVFGMLTMFLVDKFEWKRYLYIFTILSGVYLLILCIVATAINVNMFALNYYGIGIMIFFVFAAMGIDCICHVQTSEAFSYATKPWSIMFATSVEHIAHMTFIIIFKLKYDIPSFILMAIGLIVLGTCSLLSVPPKTKGLSLRQTRDIYRKTKQVVQPTA